VAAKNKILMEKINPKMNKIFNKIMMTKNKMLNNKKLVHKLNSHNNLMVKKRQKKSK
jgi:hypothetical protein